MQEIIIDGVNLNGLKAKHDALQAEISATRRKIRQGASKFIAEKIAEARTLIDDMLEEEDQNLVDTAAEHAHDLLSVASFVSDMSGVAFDLPYRDQNYDYPEGEPYSNQIEGSKNEALQNSVIVDKLYGLLESMESEVSDWNASYC